jgi:hypothetical protein
MMITKPSGLRAEPPPWRPENPLERPPEPERHPWQPPLPQPVSGRNVRR